MAFIEIKGLVKKFGAFTALGGIDVAVEEREFVTFLGPSGCGKTTTLRVLAGFLSPDAGTVAVGGQVLSSPDRVVPPEERRMGMVFQNYAVWPHMTVYENVAFGLRYAGITRREQAERMDNILASMGLEGMEARHPGQLSGGQQQRVALARSLVVEPSILLLDEPLSNLDAKLRERMRFELKALQRRTGITFVYVTHDQAEAMALSDRIVVFRGGAVQQIGSPRDVYERPANMFVADFMGLVNRLTGTIVGIGGEGLVVDVGGQRLIATAHGSAGSTGLPVTIAIRPEAFVLGDIYEGRVNKLKGTVTEATFLGNIVDYQIDAGGLNLRVQGDRTRFFPAGSEVVLSVPVAECVAMPVETDDNTTSLPQSGNAG